jgi:hypothetical protein
MRYLSRRSSKPKMFDDETLLNGTDMDRRPEFSTEVHLSGLGWYFVPGGRNSVGVWDERDRKGYFARLAKGRTSTRGVHSGHLMGSELLSSCYHEQDSGPWSGSSAEHTFDSGEEERSSAVVLVHVLQALIKAKEGRMTSRCF